MLNIPISGVFNPLYPRNNLGLAPTLQTINLYAGDDGYIVINVVDGDGAPYDISSGALVLSVRGQYQSLNDDPVISREAVILTSNSAYFIIGTGDTSIAPAVYTYDVVYIDTLGNTTHLIQSSQFNILKSNYVSGQDVTVPPSQQPLAQGPPGALVITGVSPGSYTSTNLTVDAYGRLTSASNGSGGGGSNTFSARFTDNANFIDLSLSGVTSAIYGDAARIPIINVDGYGRLTQAANQSILITESQVSNLTTDLTNRALTSTAINTTSRLIGGGNLSASRTLDLNTSGVTAGSYTSTNLTVDAYGRITSASNGSGGGGISGTISSNQIAYGIGSNTIAGSSALYYDGSTFVYSSTDGYTKITAQTNDILLTSGNSSSASIDINGSTGIITLTPQNDGVIDSALQLTRDGTFQYPTLNFVNTNAGDPNTFGIHLNDAPVIDYEAANGLIFHNNFNCYPPETFSIGAVYRPLNVNAVNLVADTLSLLSGGSVGFYGTAPIAQVQQSTITTLADMKAFLVSLGLLGPS